MTNIQVSLSKNGKVTLLTAGKYCPDNIDVFVYVPSERYATISAALSGTSPTADGPVGAYSDDIGGKHLVLLDDISSASTIGINQPCALHLNGHKLTFTTGAAYLNVTAETTIDGRVAGSEITKSVGSGSTRLVSATGVHLTIIGGKYSMSNISTTAAIAIRAESAATKIDMTDCEVVVTGIGSAIVKGMQAYGTVTITDCRFTTTAKNNAVSGIHALGTLNMKNTSVVAYSDGDTTVSSDSVKGVESYTNGSITLTDCNINAKSYKSGVHVYGVYAYTASEATLNNCTIDADGVADVGTTIYSVCAVDVNLGATAYINGGTYWGAREALSIHGTAYINGGTYNGCQHGGGYFSGTDVKVKNATFVNVEYTGDLWNAPHYGSVYCGGSGVAANVYFDSCFFNVENKCNSGLVSKYTGTSVYISNSSFGDNLTVDMRVTKGNYIYIGENVDYDAAAVNIEDGGVFDTTTYAGQRFTW